MKRYVLVAVVMLTASRTSAAAGSLEAQETCLEDAVARYSEASRAITDDYLKYVERCDLSGPGEYVDRCYSIAARRFETASQVAKSVYEAEVSACLR